MILYHETYFHDQTTHQTPFNQAYKIYHLLIAIMNRSFKSIHAVDPWDIEHRVTGHASYNVSNRLPDFILCSNNLRPVALAPRFSRSRPARRSRLSPPSNTVAPARGAKGLLALPAPILYRIVSFITRPCTVSRFCSRWTRRPIYISTLTAFATTSIYLLLSLQYHIDLPPGFLRRKVKPKQEELLPQSCCEMDPEEANRRIKNMAATERAMEEHEMRAKKYYLGERKYYEGSYTLGQLESALEERTPKPPRPKPAFPVRQWIQKLPEPYPNQTLRPAQ